jgi:LysM repeat protein
MPHKLLVHVPRLWGVAILFAWLTTSLSIVVRADGPPASTLYTVQYGDSLSAIATRYGVSMQALMQANGLSIPYAYVGRTLQIPAGYTPVAGSTLVYIVQPGDTLFSIARRYGVSVTTLMRLNYLYNPNIIFAGMRLHIPRANPAPPYQTYIVRRGDTLSGIAIHFGTSIYALMVANNIPNPNLIFAGMRLIIPGSISPRYPTPGMRQSYPTAPATTRTPAPATSVPGTTVNISMQNLAFQPSALTIHVGTMVVWKNNESNSVPHTVTSGTPNAPSGMFDSGTLNPGQAFQFKFNTVGTFAYYCRIHGAMMTGTITVVP